ncbi:tumor necrosis factor receptor superfamily member 16-like [Branchiostoma lanceolatum]|uniref:tumor necrosis factor receptor superfamily member 16-like n=1 Tax=Branchiostoma lanceolatum TaxID=7740 RepID=UPI003454144C
MTIQSTVILIMVLWLMTVHVSVGERCYPCPSGMYWKSDCLEGFPNTTICEICASGTFLPRPNTAEGCFVHKVCDKPNMITKSRGNVTHDTVCGCEDGYYLERGSCVRNVYCPPGEGIVDNGQRCESCSNETYSDIFSNVEPCLPWTNCSEEGVAKEGTSFSDRVCIEKSKKEPATTTHSTTVTSMEETTAGMHEIYAILPTTSTVTLITVAIVIGLVGLVGTYTLVVRKECKHCRKKRPEIHDLQVEDEILVLEGPDVGEDVVSSVECEEDSISTNPKVRQVSSSPFDQADSKWLLHSESSNHLLPSRDMPVPDVAGSAFENLTLDPEGLEDEEPVAEEENQLEQSSPRDIPSMLPENPLVSPVASTIASSRQTSDSSRAYRQEGVDLVLGVYGKELTRRQLEQLAAEIGQDWPYLAQRLGLKQYQVDHTLNGYKADMQEQVYAMLQNWQQQKTGNATIAELNAALLECNRGELCRRLLSLSDAAKM